MTLNKDDDKEINGKDKKGFDAIKIKFSIRKDIRFHFPGFFVFCYHKKAQKDCFSSLGFISMPVT